VTSINEQIKVDLELSLDTVVGEQHRRQVGEDTWDSEPMTLLDAIINVAADRVVARVDAAARERYDYGYSSILAHKIEPEIDARVSAMVDGLMEKAIQQTDGFGRSKGEPRPLEEIVLDRAEKWLNGQAQGEYYGSSNKKGTRLERALESLLDRQLTAALDKVMATARAEALAKLAPVAEAAVHSAVREALGQVVATR
jgi:hypothetical protein